jgi:hypothetical protein
MKLLIYDSTRKKSPLDEGWGVGAFWQWLWHGTDGVLGALTWHEAIEWICNRGALGKIHEIQFWGHGVPGDALINKDSLAANLEELKQIKPFIRYDTNFWLRTCASFHGETGKQFAMNLYGTIGCRVLAHTFKIGFPWHSGLHSVKNVLDIDRWSNKEGEDEKGNLLGSSMQAPNTITMFHEKAPKEW